jgi:hypothetical protein
MQECCTHLIKKLSIIQTSLCTASLQAAGMTDAQAANTPVDTSLEPATAGDVNLKPPSSFCLDHMDVFRNKVNIMTTDMPHAVVSTEPDPPLSRPDVVVMVPTASASLPPRKDLLDTIRSLTQGGKLGRHSGYRMEELSHPNSTAVTAQALYFYNMDDGSAFPGIVVRFRSFCDS